MYLVHAIYITYRILQCRYIFNIDDVIASTSICPLSKIKLKVDVALSQNENSTHVAVDFE